MPPALVTHLPATPSDRPDDVRLAQNGDTEAFARLYRLHVGRINALALRLTGERRKAEELVQDAFVRAWQKLGTFRGESALPTWLHRLTVNVFLLDDRSDRRRALRELPEESAPESMAAIPRPAMETEDRIDLERAIARLPDGARIAFVLHDIHGYDHAEIAAMSGVAPATIRVQLHRARRRLKEMLDP
ncbi:MAG: RNA polymerase sigma factor [Gemmatimonadetes bacterium]|nr:RNA polymerase sigma factor [Gemmatimonadota bacterium]